MPDRDITKRYRKHYDYAYHVPCALLKTSFGCPYNCKFCFCVEITAHSYYERELQPVIEELKQIKEPNVFIVDDNFLVDRERIKTFCKLLDENNIHKTFIIFGRADFIVNNPDIILADEPTGNLDLESGNKLMAFVKRTNEEQGQTYVIVTHDLEWLKIAHTVYRMSDGKLEREVLR